MYTLAICDERGFGALREGGVFNPNTGLTFALYTTQAYTPLASGEHRFFLGLERSNPWFR